MTTRLLRISTLALFLAAFVSCGDSGLKGDSGFTVDTLEGNWEATEECTVEFDGAVADLSGCIISGGLFNRPDVTFSTARVVVMEEEVTVSASGTYPLASVREGCASAELVIDVVIAGSLTKSSGRQVEGPFAALAGTWSGAVTITETLEPVELLPEAPAGCEDLVEGDSLITRVEIDADVFGDRAVVTTDEGEFEISGDAETISVEGQVFEKQ